VSSNEAFSSWAEIFGDAVAVAARDDRLVPHAEVFVLQGDSYRLKDRGVTALSPRWPQDFDLTVAAVRRPVKHTRSTPTCSAAEWSCGPQPDGLVHAPPGAGGALQKALATHALPGVDEQTPLDRLDRHFGPR
jgi:IstB-like ATP binding protein